MMQQVRLMMFSLNMVDGDFSVSPRPLGFGFWGFGAKGLGPGLDNKYDIAAVLAYNSQDIFQTLILQFIFLLNYSEESK